MRKKILSLSIFALLLSGTSFVSAQSVSCGEGYKLVPVVNIDFGTVISNSRELDSNDTWEKAIKESFVTENSLSYNSSVGSKGTYAIVKNPHDVRPSWATNGTDHTGNPNGGMLFADGNESKVTLFTMPIPVCEGSDFEFEAWYANGHGSDNSNKPKLTFAIFDADTYVAGITKIEDAIVSNITEEVSPNSNLVWNRGSLTFKVKDHPEYSNKSLILAITNETGGGSGNDFVIDDITVWVCVPTIKPEWGNNLSAGQDIIGVECDAVTRDIPITISDDEALKAYENGLVYYVWQYNDTKNGNEFAENGWNIVSDSDIKTSTGNYLQNVEKSAPNADKQRAWRLVLANDPTLAKEIANGDRVATGCSFGAVTSPIIFECLPCQVPNISLAADKNIACIQDGVNEIITLTANVAQIDAEDNWVVDNSDVTLIWLKNGSEVGRGDLNNRTFEIPVQTPSGVSVYTVRAAKSSCSNDSNTQSITINDPMIIELKAENALFVPLTDNTSIIKRDVRLSVEFKQGGVPNAFEWSWNNISTPAGAEMWVSPLKNTTYEVSATDGTCSATAQIEIKVKPLPTAFAPFSGYDNIDGKFAVYNVAQQDEQIGAYSNMVILNRYGQEVYKGVNPWNGTVNGSKLAESGTYFYIITFADGDILRGTIEVIKK